MSDPFTIQCKNFKERLLVGVKVCIESNLQEQLRADFHASWDVGHVLDGWQLSPTE